MRRDFFLGGAPARAAMRKETDKTGKISGICEIKGRSVCLLAKVEAALWCGDVGLEGVLASRVDGGDSGVGLLLFVVWEELVHDVEALLVNLEVLVVLQVVDGDHATCLLDVLGVLVDGTWSLLLLVHLTDLEDVLKTVEGDLDDLVVDRAQEITHWANAALADEVADLGRLRETTGSGVGDGPACLLLGLEVGILENVDERGNNVGVNDGLDLVRRAGSDVGDGPACLLADAVLGRGEQAKESGEGTRGDDHLGLEVVTSDNVTNGTKGWGLNGSRWVEKEVHKATADTAVNDGLDLVVDAVGKV